MVSGQTPGQFLTILAALACTYDIEACNSLGTDSHPLIRAGSAATVAHMAVCDCDQRLVSLFTSLAHDSDGLVRGSPPTGRREPPPAPRAEIYEHLTRTKC